MYKPTDSQSPLFDAGSRLSESARRRLEDSWAHGFLEHVWPILLEHEDKFADLYADVGRGSWSVARKLGILTLQELNDLTDNETVDHFCFDIRWQYALGCPPEEAYLSRQGLSDFRGRLVDDDPEMSRLYEVFEAILEVAAEDLGISMEAQRLDSTHVTSNIRTKGRADLFSKTLRHFHRQALASDFDVSDEFSSLTSAFRKWLDDKPEGRFGGRSDEEYRVRLQQLAEWTLELVDTFGGHPIAHTEPYELLLELLNDHCEVVGDDDSDSEDGDFDEGDDVEVSLGDPGGDDDHHGKASSCRVEVVEPSSDSSSLQSPYDPDAGYCHKGVGYTLHVSETCDNLAPVELISDFVVNPAETDGGRLPTHIHRLSRRGRKPRTYYADAGYVFPNAVARGASRDVDVIGPISRGNQPKGRDFGREAFEFDEEGKIEKCLNGKTPIRHGMRRSRSRRRGQARYAFFARQDCDNCPFQDGCPVTGPDNGHPNSPYQIELRPVQRFRDRRLAEQKTDEFWETYAIRNGIEATFSELSRKHGVKDLRVRRLPRVRLKVSMKIIACNVKRWLREVVERLFCLFTLLWTQHWPAPDPTRPSPRVTSSSCPNRLCP